MAHFTIQGCRERECSPRFSRSNGGLSDRTALMPLQLDGKRFGYGPSDSTVTEIDFAPGDSSVSLTVSGSFSFELGGIPSMPYLPTITAKVNASAGDKLGVSYPNGTELLYIPPQYLTILYRYTSGDAKAVVLCSRLRRSHDGEEGSHVSAAARISVSTFFLAITSHLEARKIAEPRPNH